MLKVDRSFVGGIGDRPRRGPAIAGSIIGLGETLEMVVVAEGIETPDQLAQVLALGCRFGQGFISPRRSRPPTSSRSARAGAARSARASVRPMIMQVALPCASSFPLAASVSSRLRGRLAAAAVEDLASARTSPIPAVIARTIFTSRVRVV